MSKRDEAVEAWAAAVDAAYNPDRYPIMAAMFRDYADAGLDAALAVLQPTVPNEVEALEALPQVQEAQVSHQTGTAVVTLTGPVEDDILRRTVEDKGYTVTAIR